MATALNEQTAAMKPRLSERMRRDFAVIVPAYNEVENIPELVAELRALFEQHDLHGEVLLVDDGSTDGTGAAARRHAETWPALRVLQHRRNFGKTEALVTASEATQATWVVVYDADMQHSPEEIPRFLAKLEEGWDIVCGRKVGRYEKAAVSGVYNRLSRAIFDIPVSDTNSMKAFRREIFDEVRLRHDWHRFFVVLAYARGYTATEIDIELLPRRHGVAKYAGRGRILVGMLDLVSVAFFLFFSRKPLILFGASGLVMAALGMLVGIITIVLRVAHWMPPFGFRPLLYLVILLMVLGFLLVGFGFVAELVAQQQAELDALHRRLARDERSGTADAQPAVMRAAQTSQPARSAADDRSAIEERERRARALDGQ